jgi:hypothetical protein
MTTHSHTAVTAGAAATAATINAPLAQLDAALNPTVAAFSAEADNSTTVTTASTYYAEDAPAEVAFTPAYAGQVFEISLVIGRLYAGTAGITTWNLRVTDGAGATVFDSLIKGQTHGVSSDYGSAAGTRCWTAGAGDVGVARKAKVYLTHTVNATVVHTAYVSIDVVAHI